MGAASLSTAAPALGQSPLAQEPQRVSSATVAVGDEVVERSVDDLRRSLETGQLTARTLTQAYLAGSTRSTARAPGLNSVIELNPDALASPTARRGAQGEAACAGRCTASRS